MLADKQTDRQTDRQTNKWTLVKTRIVPDSDPARFRNSNPARDRTEFGKNLFSDHRTINA